MNDNCFQFNYTFLRETVQKRPWCSQFRGSPAPGQMSPSAYLSLVSPLGFTLSFVLSSQSLLFLYSQSLEVWKCNSSTRCLAAVSPGKLITWAMCTQKHCSQTSNRIHPIPSAKLEGKCFFFVADEATESQRVLAEALKRFLPFIGICRSLLSCNFWRRMFFAD